MIGALLIGEIFSALIHRTKHLTFYSGFLVKLSPIQTCLTQKSKKLAFQGALFVGNLFLDFIGNLMTSYSIEPLSKN